jgi:hypothetical protein
MVQRSIPIHVFRTNPVKRASRSRRKIKTKKSALICLSMVCVKAQFIVSMHVLVPLKVQVREVSVCLTSGIGTICVTGPGDS